MTNAVRSVDGYQGLRPLHSREELRPRAPFRSPRFLAEREAMA